MWEKERGGSGFGIEEGKKGKAVSTLSFPLVSFPLFVQLSCSLCASCLAACSACSLQSALRSPPFLTTCLISTTLVGWEEKLTSSPSFSPPSVMNLLCLFRRRESTRVFLFRKKRRDRRSRPGQRIVVSRKMVEGRETSSCSSLLSLRWMLSNLVTGEVYPSLSLHSYPTLLSVIFPLPLWWQMMIMIMAISI